MAEPPNIQGIVIGSLRAPTPCPTWLEFAYKRLDQAVFTAYGWTPDLSDEEILEKLLALNLERTNK